MWKAFLAFVGHRILLFFMASLVIHSHLAELSAPIPGAWGSSPVWHEVQRRIASLPEHESLQKILPLGPVAMLRASQDPYQWINYALVRFLRFPATLAMLLLSNVFFCLFLCEVYSLLSRMVTPEIATGGAVLAVLWPTSYEMSMGSYFAVPCFLAALTVREALDNRWLMAGVALGLLALVEPCAILLVPLLIYVFWYFQNHFPIAVMARELVMFLLPLGLAIAWRSFAYRNLGQVLADSALLNLFTVKTRGESMLRWTFSHSYLGQTVTILFFTLGAILALLSNVMLIHKLVPVTGLAMLLLFSPYGAIASRALVAAPALQGTASHSSRVTMGLLQMVLLLLGLYEVYAVFS